MGRLIAPALTITLLLASPAHARRYAGADGKLRVTLVQQPFSPNGTSAVRETRKYSARVLPSCD